MQRTYLAWIGRLPEVGAPIRQRRTAILAQLDEADQLEARAHELRRAAREAGAQLTSRVVQLWSPDEVARARSLPDDAAAAERCAKVEDPALREILRSVSGTAGPLDLLRAFEAAQLIRQQDTKPDADRDTLAAAARRIRDWWEAGARPVLEAHKR